MVPGRLHMMQRIRRFLEGPSVHCSDIDMLLTRLQGMKNDGPLKLQVMSDFDHTLTCHHVNGQSGCTSHGVIETTSLLPATYRQKAEEAKQKFYPIEISHEYTVEEKWKAMDQWWEIAHQLLLEYGITQDMIPKMVQEANIVLREGDKKLFNLLEDYDIPVTVFSAGLTDIIKETLQLLSYLPSNMEIVSNKMIFNDNGELVGFSKPVVHSYSKGSHALKMMKHVTSKLKGRQNVILLGDSQGDPFMVDGLTEVQSVIKIGYLNHKEDDLLSIYKTLYDIVLTKDNTSLEIPHVLLEYVLYDQHDDM